MYNVLPFTFQCVGEVSLSLRHRDPVLVFEELDDLRADVHVVEDVVDVARSDIPGTQGVEVFPVPQPHALAGLIVEGTEAGRAFPERSVCHVCRSKVNPNPANAAVKSRVRPPRYSTACPCSGSAILLGGQNRTRPRGKQTADDAAARSWNHPVSVALFTSTQAWVTSPARCSCVRRRQKSAMAGCSYGGFIHTRPIQGWVSPSSSAV